MSAFLDTFDTIAEPPYQRPGECQHSTITDAALDDRDILIVTTWGNAEPLRCPDCREDLYPWHGESDVVYVGEPRGAGADPFDRPDPRTHPEAWTE